MARISRADSIDAMLLSEVEAHPRDLVHRVCQQLKLTRPAVLARAHRLIDDGYLISSGSTRPIYSVGSNRRARFHFKLDGLSEDVVWLHAVRPLLNEIPRNVLDICQYGLTEMVNNAIDHSEGDSLDVRVDKSTDRVAIVLADDGIGIFRKIARHLTLPDDRLALLELAKGKLTTDPVHHSGEGIFFASRMFDIFQIISGGLVFDHQAQVADDFLWESNTETDGTVVRMETARESVRELKDIFTAYSSGPDEYSFAKTVVPVRLARLGDENLVSRSQAKRLLQRVERFRTVMLDFTDVDNVGQAFADEIFRVFVNAHPEVTLIPIHAKPDVQQMINRARAA